MAVNIIVREAFAPILANYFSAGTFVAKHRNGSLDTVKLGFIGKFTKFCDLEKANGYGGGYGGSGGDARGLGAGTTFSTQSTFEQEASARPAPAPTTIRLGSRVNGPGADGAFGKPLPPSDDAPPF